MTVPVAQSAGLSGIQLPELGHAEPETHDNAAEHLVVIGDLVHVQDPAAFPAGS